MSENQLAIKALASPVRRRIVELLRDGEMSVNALAEYFDVTRPGISRHLRVLRDARLVRVRSDHNVRYYSLNLEEMDRLKRGFDAEFTDFWRPQGKASELSKVELKTQEVITAYEVQVAAEFPVDAETAFRYLTEEELFRSWVGTDANTNPVVGGKVEATSAFGGRLVGEYLAINPGRLLVVRLLAPLDAESNLYTIALEPKGKHTLVTLRHFVRDRNVALLVEMAWGETWKLLKEHLEARSGVQPRTSPSAL